ncbi:hypothetical protein [Paenibacillus sp. FSL H8-0259]|uniref:hypothetical protein n=1 Tax=Paenibacillus sp. FSL H8-0259 TaxID=1920423 RepID=UPI00096CAA89|nr:hypothetical protein [Paenibacillus sp. FSL H8-0259]OMF21223.1 hypothetical protein BK132_33730 [Paenibacillus sp. FSL H8-0259]
MEKNGDMAILVVSCDAYADVAEYFFPLYYKYWSDSPFPVYFVNNTLSKDYGQTVTVINAGNEKDWSGRVKLALGQIKEKYILFMLEDYYIGKHVNSKKISEALNIMDSEKIVYYRITNQPKGKSEYKKYKYLSPIADNQAYGVNLQAAIWEKEFFEKSLGDIDCSAWAVEINHLKKVKDKFSGNIKGCVIDTREIIDIHNGVIKGKWVPKTLKYFEKNGFSIDKGARGVLSLKNQLSINARASLSPIFSNESRRFLKKNLSKLGFSFTSDK